jgi:hypothetical protein
MQLEDALTLTPESVMLLLTDMILSYVEQNQFYEFIIKWVEFDLESREEFFPDLFCSLDLQSIPRDVLEKIDNYSLIKKYERCQTHILMRHKSSSIEADDGVKEAILVVRHFKQFYEKKIADQPPPPPLLQWCAWIHFGRGSMDSTCTSPF